MYILCKNNTHTGSCRGVIAKIRGKMIDITRSKNKDQRHRIMILGSDVSIIATCPCCFEQTPIIIKNNEISKDDLILKEKLEDGQDNQHGGSGGQPNPENSTDNGGANGQDEVEETQS